MKCWDCLAKSKPKNRIGNFKNQLQVFLPNPSLDLYNNESEMYNEQQRRKSPLVSDDVEIKFED